VLGPCSSASSQSTSPAMPAYKNAYAPPPPPQLERDIHLHTPAEDYDLNFCLTTQPIGVLKGADHDVELEPLVVRPTFVFAAPRLAAPVAVGGSRGLTSFRAFVPSAAEHARPGPL